MSRLHRPADYRTVPARCANCSRCRAYVEGPNAGRCIYGGPFAGYQRYLAGGYSPPFTEPPS